MQKVAMTYSTGYGAGDRRPDVAIWGITNPRAAVTLRRIASACVAAGLETTIVWREYQGRAALTPVDYEVTGASFEEVTIRYDYGPIRYPRSLVLPLLQRDVDRVLARLQPKCIITQLDHGLVDRVWQHVARRRRIPGVVIQEGMANVPKRLPDHWSVEARSRWRWGKRGFLNDLVSRIPHPLLRSCAPYMFAEYACVWGDAMRRHLLHLGRTEETIFVTGSPAFDDVHGMSALRDGREKVVLFAQQRMGLPLKDRMPFYEQLIRVVTQGLRCRLLFKLHPNSFSEAGEIRRLATKLGAPDSLIEVIDSGDAVDLLPKTSVLVVATSTTAYHAAVAGVPLVVVDYCSDAIRFDTRRTGGAAVVREPGELEGTLRRALWNQAFRRDLYEDARRLLTDHLFALDGHAAERVAEVVNGLIRRCSPGEGCRL